MNRGADFVQPLAQALWRLNKAGPDTVHHPTKLLRKKNQKIPRQRKHELDNTIKAITNNPSIGTEKNGDLRGIFVYKFKIIKTEYLLSYRVVGEDLELITIGPHENYYRDLKSYLKNR